MPRAKCQEADEKYALLRRLWGKTFHFNSPWATEKGCRCSRKTQGPYLVPNKPFTSWGRTYLKEVTTWYYFLKQISGSLTILSTGHSVANGSSNRLLRSKNMQGVRPCGFSIQIWCTANAQIPPALLTKSNGGVVLVCMLQRAKRQAIHGKVFYGEVSSSEYSM